jgi:hypothetical protein
LTTLITDFTGNPFTVTLLSDLTGLGAANITSKINFQSAVDVQIFIKYDWTPPES